MDDGEALGLGCAREAGFAGDCRGGLGEVRLPKGGRVVTEDKGEQDSHWKTERSRPWVGREGALKVTHLGDEVGDLEDQKGGWVCAGRGLGAVVNLRGLQECINCFFFVFLATKLLFLHGFNIYFKNPCTHDDKLNSTKGSTMKCRAPSPPCLHPQLPPQKQLLSPHWQLSGGLCASADPSELSYAVGTATLCPLVPLGICFEQCSSHVSTSILAPGAS